MKRDDLFIWIIVALLAAAIAITIIWAPRRTKHGYGNVGGQALKCDRAVCKSEAILPGDLYSRIASDRKNQGIALHFRASHFNA
jgi:hypothetical protein